MSLRLCRFSVWLISFSTGRPWQSQPKRRGTLYPFMVQ